MGFAMGATSADAPRGYTSARRATDRNVCPTRTHAEERPKGADVAAVVAGTVNGSFREERAFGRTKQRVVQDAGEGFPADVAAADVLMAVEARAERNLGIVAVNDADVFEAEGGAGCGEGSV